jgi:hypothetical protein
MAALLLTMTSATAFAMRPMGLGAASPIVARTITPTMNGGAFLALEAIEPAVTSYVSIWTPLFEGAKASGLAPELVLHW